MHLGHEQVFADRSPLCARYPSSSYFVARHLGRGREHRGNAIRKYWML
jgi:hypothetical protein